MPGETAAANKRYLHRVLVDGESTFRYRGRVRTLLGLPDVGGVVMNFAEPLPFAGFAGLRARDDETFGIPEGLRLESAPGESGVPWPVQRDYGNHSLQRGARPQTDGREPAPTTRRLDASGRASPMVVDGTTAADAFSPSGLNTDGSSAAHSTVRAQLHTSPLKIHQVVIPGASQLSGSRPQGNIAQPPTPVPAPIPNSASNDASTTIESPRSTLPGASAARPVLATPIPGADRHCDLDAPVVTLPVAGVAVAAADTRTAPDAAAPRNPNDESAQPAAVLYPRPMPRIQPRTVVAPAHERLVAPLKTSSISALDPVDIHRGDSELPRQRFSLPGRSAKPAPKAAPPTGAAAAPPPELITAHMRNTKAAETGGYAPADSTVDQALAVPLPPPPIVVVQQAQGPSTPTPAFWERRHLALWRLRFGR